tara:strand:- start:53300 stop:53704 length:405 start_codon:yes stop_codon:yes gene_type:complete
MLSFLTAKTALKKSWTWIKHNWYVPAVLIYTLILWLFFRRKDKALEVLQIRSDSYRKQIDAINEIHGKEVEKKNKILEKYGTILKELEEKYEKDNLELDSKKKEEVKKLVEEYNEKPAELAKLLAEKYGLEYVE